jgi:ribonuclease Z
MRLILLGTGAALPDPDRCHTSILLTLNNGRHFLIDCGHGATRQMMRVNVNPADVSHLLLTHLHHDHVCELPFFVISSWILGRAGAPDIHGPKGTRHLVTHLFEGGAFDADIRARSAYPVRQANIEAVRPHVTEFDAGIILVDNDIKVVAECVDHIPSQISPCYGFRIEAEGKVNNLQRRHCALRRHRAVIARRRSAHPRMHLHRSIPRTPASFQSRDVRAHQSERPRQTRGGV